MSNTPAPAQSAKEVTPPLIKTKGKAKEVREAPALLDENEKVHTLIPDCCIRECTNNASYRWACNEIPGCPTYYYCEACYKSFWRHCDNKFI